jgi:hypothetical protein
MSNVGNDDASTLIALGEQAAKREYEDEYQLDFDILSRTLDKIASREVIHAEEMQRARAALERLNQCMVDSVSR